MERDTELKEEWIVDFTQRFLKQHTVERSEDMLAELLRIGLGNERKVRDYLIISDYGTMLNATGSVMKTMYQLADKYNLSDRQVQNVIYAWRGNKAKSRTKK